MSEHELCHRSVSTGLEELGINNNPKPFWFCTCGEWRIYRNPIGIPTKRAAQVLWRAHVKEAGDADS